MAEVAKQIKVTDASSGDDDVPPPPPLPRPQVLQSLQKSESQNFLPVPPPKETFSEFYQQQQKSELKRLFKHIHPELKMNLDDVVDEELIGAINPQALDTAYQGEVQSMRWIFENWTLDNIGDPHETKKLLNEENLQGGDVRGKSSLFEHSVFDSQHTTVGERPGIVKGDVRTATWLFETQPLDSISQTKMENEEMVEVVLKEPVQKGDVRGTRLLFESKPLDALGRCCSVEDQHFLKLKSELQENKGDVKKTVELFQADPSCAIKDSSGKIHEIKSICREEIQGSDFKTARWLFETQPLNDINKRAGVQIIRGISLEEAQKGGVDEKKWMFETQPLDAIHEGAMFKGMVEGISGEADVHNKLKLFENQPLSSLKGKSEGEISEEEEIIGGNVGSTLWLFETQPMDALKDNYEVGQERVKEIFESKSLHEIGSEFVKDSKEQKDEIQSGSVHKFTWLFENQPISDINEKEDKITCSVSDVEGGDVGSKKFIFETFSLDKIQDKDKLLKHQSMSVENPTSSSGNVKSSSMLFESQPLYAIRDKDGQFHEVTTVKKEELMRGDVRGARWMFETKPLDTIQADKEIYVIRAVTQEDVCKGDVKSARWKFETQPFDSITPREGPSVRVVEDIGNGKSVQQSKQLFETDQANQKKFVRMVSVTDVQQGDVRTSTWLFENQPIDTLKGEPDENNTLTTVHREDNTKGDVKRCTWLFESQPLDKIKNDESTEELASSKEEIPKTDVKSTTWLFETTPLDKITVESVTDILYRLCHYSFIHSSGIIIQANDYKYVNMAKYQIVQSEGPKVQKEEVVEGNIRNIMLQLLFKPNLKPKVVLLKEDEQGKMHSTVLEIPFQQSGYTDNPEAECKTQEAVKIIENLLIQQKTIKTGLVMQESEGGQPEMTVYSLQCQSCLTESQDIARGDVKSTIGNLLATVHNQQTKASCRLEQNERGNVGLYRSCIEKGDLKSLQQELSEEELSASCRDKIEIIQGDVKEAKRHLIQQREQAERTVMDVIPGDVKNAKKVFSEVCIDLGIGNCVPKEEIVKGDILSAMQQLDEAIKQPVMVQKEEIVSGDIKATLESLEQAKQQSKHLEREVIKPGTIYDLNIEAEETCLEENERTLIKEEIISGDVKAAKRSLERAKNQSMRVEREPVTPGKLYNLNESSQCQSNTTMEQSTTSSLSNQRITTTFRK
ncbi:xin actin-binding repeat-containing protein 1-like [Carassius carassius]|uniref:xin actin-binding repeat-containing protein 1-like n=1 Tax=Carassius carassius TaxID=217509 RepID=UPI0028696E17|nr:xin actin-binding repeat-containing protein 1-like [Carassius carassius]